ncbi:unnamed protein product (macronuclear) [Paramecium tetraurelia]|uniref:Uncharacterized protein n=1 Tax=Paramecium tetraurelia TaxID=5888 RepID=A0CM27_PARTE|nr:uncharacterized protein GSPATT00008323001 [Paramecium tetraurelia]CAK71844.1 unnamed protein product [Paramecium tetraurelia]|eukprot:XP_001439241.1 hypothetical protein (macronuclear) [Paramecium tetraurelia strain d4-2]
MIRTNSSVQIQKLQIPLQQISPFNGQIRYSNPYSDTPSTPQKSIIAQQIRGSSTFTPNKTQQTFYFKENSNTIESKIQSLVNENCYLNQELEKARNEIQNNAQQQEQLYIIKERVSKLEELIDTQQNEIEIWKLKYQKAAAGDSRLEIQQMEQQIYNVIDENERLNKIISNLEQQHQEKDQEIKTLMMSIQKYEVEMKKQKDKLIILEKANKPAVSCNPFAMDNKKPSKSSISDLRQSKCKISEQDAIANRKKSDHVYKQVQTKSQQDYSDLQNQIKQLQVDNQQLQLTIEELQEKLQSIDLQKSEKKDSQKDPNQDQNISILKQELSNQQILILEEFKKYKQCQSQNTMIKEQLLQWEQFLKSLNSQICTPNEEEDGIDAAIEEFQSSSANCLQLIDQFQK